MAGLVIRSTQTALLALGAAAAVPAGGGVNGQDTIPPTDTFTLTGQIVDAVNGNAVISAVVKFPELRRFVFSDTRGRFRAPDFPAGTWDIVVEMLGYHTLDGPITVAEGNGLLLRLNPDPIALEGLRVRSRADVLLERRRRRYPYRVDHISPQAIADAINPDPTAIFRWNANVPLRTCDFGPVEQVHGCYDSRGRVRGVRVLLDDAPLLGGMNELQMFPSGHIHSMDWLPGKGELRVYTTFFVERLINSHMSLAPFDPFE